MPQPGDDVEIPLSVYGDNPYMVLTGSVKSVSGNNVEIEVIISGGNEIRTVEKADLRNVAPGKWRLPMEVKRSL